MLTLLWLATLAIGLVVFAYINAAGWLWILGVGFALITALALHVMPGALVAALGVIALLLAVPLNVPWLRRLLITDGVLAAFRKVLPQMSPTEQEALDAGHGVVGRRVVQRDSPTGTSCSRCPKPTLTDGGTGISSTVRFEELCAMIDDWEITHELQRSAAAGLAIHQGPGLPRHDHPEGSTAARVSRR